MAALHGTYPLRSAKRSAKLSVNLTADIAEQLNRLARDNHWTASTAAAVLIERGLAAGKDSGSAPREQARDSAA